MSVFVHFSLLKKTVRGPGPWQGVHGPGPWKSSMDLVQSGGPWTPGLCFVLTPLCVFPKVKCTLYLTQKGNKFTWNSNLEKSQHFATPITVFAVECSLRNKHRNSILMTCHYPDLGSASVIGWSKFPQDTANQKYYPDLGPVSRKSR